MSEGWNRAGIIASILGGIAVMFTVLWYAFDIEMRLRKVEAITLTLSTSGIPSAPAIVPKVSSPNYGTRAVPDTHPANPMDVACAQLANRLADAIDSSAVSSAVAAYKDELKLLNCNARAPSSP